MKGWLYRLAIAVKEAGERLRFPALIRLGLAIKDRALALQVKVMMAGNDTTGVESGRPVARKVNYGKSTRRTQRAQGGNTWRD